MHEKENLSFVLKVGIKGNEETFDLSNLPKPVFLLLPQVKIPLDNFQHMLSLLICELGEVQLFACSAARHCEADAWKLSDFLLQGQKGIMRNKNR